MSDFPCTRSRYGLQDSSTKGDERAMVIDNGMQSAPLTEAASRTTAGAPKWFGAVGLAAGLGAIVASSCCVLPLGLAALGAGAGVLGGLAAMSDLRLPFLAASGVAVAGGWAAWWRRPTACALASTCVPLERSRVTLALLLCATVIVAAAAGWGYIDPVLLKLLRGR
jgi:mercuric ion transport protein